MVHVRSPRPAFPAAVLALALATSLAGCHDRSSDPGPGTPKVPHPVQAVFPGAPKALLTASVPGEASWRIYAVDAGGGLLGAVQPVEFRDGAGNPVEPKIFDVGALTREWIWIQLLGEGGHDLGGGLPSVRQVLVRVSDGKLLDADGLYLAHAQVKGGTLYAHLADQHTLVRIDLASMAQVPLNDAASDPLVGAFLVDHQGNVRADVLHGGGSFEAKIFFADGRPPLVDPWQPGGLAYGLCDHRSPAYVTAYGEDGHVYAVCSASFPDPEGSTSTATYTGTFVREVSFTPAGTQVLDGAPVREAACGAGCIRAPVAVSTPWLRLDQRTQLVADSTGFFRTTAIPGGGISLAWTDLALPRSLWISGEHGYWKSDGTIRRIRLAAGATAEDACAFPRLSGWTVAGGVVVFTQSTGGTWAVIDPGMATRISTAELFLGQVIEL